MPLPADYRIVAQNNTGVSIDSGLLAAAIKPYSGDGSGGLSHGSEQTGSNGSSLSSGSSETLLTVSGSTDIGFIGGAEANLSTNGSAPSGTVEFYIETSTDGGSTWNRPPIAIAAFEFSSKEDKDASFVV